MKEKHCNANRWRQPTDQKLYSRAQEHQLGIQPCRRLQVFFRETDLPLPSPPHQNTYGSSLWKVFQWNIQVHRWSPYSECNWEVNRQEGQGSPNGANRLQVSDISYLSLKRQEETNYKGQIFPSLYKIKRRSFLKFCVAMTTPGSTWT